MSWISSQWTAAWTAILPEDRIIRTAVVCWIIFVIMIFFITLYEHRQHRRGVSTNWSGEHWEMFFLFVTVVSLFLAATAALTVGVNHLIDLAVTHPDDVINLTSPPYTLIIGIVAGILFFLFRCRAPLFYGLTEVGVAIATISTSANPNFNSRVLGLFGGIYILVRGLDNMNKIMKGYAPWRRIFWGKATPEASTI